MRVLVTGAAGQLGSTIVTAFADADVVAATRHTLDVTDPESVRRVVGEMAPDVVINCAAFNDVDGAEDHPADAFALNAFAVRSLARSADEAGARFVHYGTDFVYDGHATRAYTEDVPASPRSAYAMSKLVGEWFALETPRAYVLRVESLFGMPRGWTGRRGTLENIVAGLEQGRAVKVFTDRIVTPSFIPDIAAATKHLIEAEAPAGLYHCVNTGQASWYDVADHMATQLGVEPRLDPMMTDQVTLKAARPRFCALSNRKLAAAGYAMPAWQDAVKRWLATRGGAAA